MCVCAKKDKTGGYRVDRKKQAMLLTCAHRLLSSFFFKLVAALLRIVLPPLACVSLRGFSIFFLDFLLFLLFLFVVHFLPALPVSDGVVCRYS